MPPQYYIMMDLHLRVTLRQQHSTSPSNKLLIVLLLRVPMCRASVGWCFHEDKAVRSSYSKTWIMPYYIMFIHVTLCVDTWAFVRRQGRAVLVQQNVDYALLLIHIYMSYCVWARGLISSAYNNVL